MGAPQDLVHEPLLCLHPLPHHLTKWLSAPPTRLPVYPLHPHFCPKLSVLRPAVSSTSLLGRPTGIPALTYPELVLTASSTILSAALLKVA